jgi:isoleucyl-tRNA synthetase
MMRRVPEVLDCWFESGAMPYAQSHYPFENKAFFEKHFPADFINEGLDQTRGWFYTLTILAAALFGRPAFKNCIVTGLVLASDGKKMSKSLKNYTDPSEALNKFGADAIRIFLVHSGVIKADDLRYSDEGVREVLKSIILPLWNAYSFFVTYANIDGITPGAPPENPANPLDRWILSAAQTLIGKVDAALSAYTLDKAIDPIVEFIDLLNNWYIRRSRRRFWRSENDTDKADAYACLHAALTTLISVAAPFMPFTTEAIYQNLIRKGSGEWGVGSRESHSDNLYSHGEPPNISNPPSPIPHPPYSSSPHSPLPTPHSPSSPSSPRSPSISIHLTDWLQPDESRIDRELEFKMSAVQKAVSMGRALRSAQNIKVRQPLQRVEMVTRDAAQMAALVEMRDIILEELNVKEVIFRDNEADLVEYQAKANFRVLGKELGKDMKAAGAQIEALPRADIEALLAGGVVTLEVAGRRVELTAAKLEVKRIEKSGLKVLNEGSLTVALDTVIGAALWNEGAVRDLVRGIQNIRKESGLEVSDRITLTIFGSAKLEAAQREFRDFIASETLALKLEWGQRDGMIEVEAGEERWLVCVERAGRE